MKKYKANHSSFFSTVMQLVLVVFIVYARSNCLNLCSSKSCMVAEKDYRRSQSDARAIERCYEQAVLKNAMAMKQCYDAIFRTAMAMERYFLVNHRNIAPSPLRLAQNAMVLIGPHSCHSAHCRLAN